MKFKTVVRAINGTTYMRIPIPVCENLNIAAPMNATIDINEETHTFTVIIEGVYNDNDSETIIQP